MKFKFSFNLKGINLRTIAIIAIILLIVIAGIYTVKYFMRSDDIVTFEVLTEEAIPQKVQEILPRYKALERALACKVDGEVYVVATRGEKPTGGYTVDIDQLIKVKEEDKIKLVVYVTFQDPKPGDVVTQVITYPYAVAKTNLKELPDKIELKVKYEE